MQHVVTSPFINKISYKYMCWNQLGKENEWAPNDILQHVEVQLNTEGARAHGAICLKSTSSAMSWQSSLNPIMAASAKISIVSSNEGRTNAPVSARLIPCRVMAIKVPRLVRRSQSRLNGGSLRRNCQIR